MLRIINLIMHRSNIPIYLLWGCFNLLLIYSRGVLITGEAEKYIAAAQDFFGSGTFPKYTFYSLFIGLLALVSNYKLVVIIQLLLNLIALYCLMDGTKRLGGKGWLVGVLFATCYPIQYWNAALYTESIFISGLVLLWYTMLIKQWKYAILLLCVLMFTRPVMIVFAVPFALWMLSGKSKQLKIILGVGIVIMGIGALLMRIQYFPEYFSIFIDDQIICEVAATENTIEIMFSKLVYFFTLYRPHYSWTHNTINLIYPTLLIWSIFKLHRPLTQHQKFVLFLIGWLGLFIVFTCVNWNNRFIAPLLPFVFVLASTTIFQKQEAIP